MTPGGHKNYQEKHHPDLFPLYLKMLINLSSAGDRPIKLVLEGGISADNIFEVFCLSRHNRLF